MRTEQNIRFWLNLLERKLNGMAWWDDGVSELTAVVGALKWAVGDVETIDAGVKAAGKGA